MNDGTSRATYRSSAAARDANRGVVLANGGFELLDLPRTVRAPDVAFISAAHLPSGGLGAGFARVPPDLAVEVLSPTETKKRLEEKLDDYRVARVPLVWVLDPERRTVMIVAAASPSRWAHHDDQLDGDDVLPGFSCGVAELFEGM